MESIGTPWMWLSFFIFVAVIIIIELWAIGTGKPQKVTIKESLAFVLFTIIAALIFNLFIWLYAHHNYGLIVANEKSLEFFTGYLLEESLSVDNMFVFVLIFSYFSIPPELQRRVLAKGVMSAVVLRLSLILLGAWLVSHFHWVLYLFGVILLFTGIKLLFTQTKQDLSKNLLIIFLRKHLRITKTLHENFFFIRKEGLLYATPLFLALVLIELSDVIFAIDSIPAIFAITHDTFIVFTSNVFAILGLRALYFLLADMHDRFYLLRYGIAIILIFIGTKMIITPWVEVPISLTLLVIIVTLAASIFLSRRRSKWKLLN